MAFTSCSSTSKNNDYATYPSSGYGNYEVQAYDSDGGATVEQNYASSGGGGAYPTTPPDYGSSYGSTGGAATSSTSTAATGQTHTVQKGETLYRIGLNYGTTVANIKAANGLNTDLIRPGDVLVVR